METQEGDGLIRARIATAASGVVDARKNSLFCQLSAGRLNAAMMRALRFYWVCASVAAWLVVVVMTPQVQAQTKFLPGTEDLPAAPWLQVVPSATLIFDGPEGRWVDITTVGTATSADLQSFYESTLPSLGWERTSLTHWTRDEEGLTISILEENNVTVVRFQLKKVNK